MRSMYYTLSAVVTICLLSGNAQAQEGDVIDLNLDGQGSASIVVEGTQQPAPKVQAADAGEQAEAAPAEEVHPCSSLFPASYFGGLSMVEGSAKPKSSKKGSSCKLKMTATEMTLEEVMATLQERMTGERFEVKLSKRGDKLKATRSTEERSDLIEVKGKAKKGELTLSVQWSAAVYTRDK